MQEGIESNLQLNSDPPFLQPLGSLCQRQPCVECFTKVVCTRGGHAFAWHLYDVIEGKVSGKHMNMFIECLITGGLSSLRVSPSLTSKAIIGKIEFGENFEPVIIPQTSVKGIHTEKAVSVFGVVSLWVDEKNSMSFHVEPWMLKPTEMTSLMHMSTLNSGQ